MRDLVHGIKPLMALLLVLAIALPVGLTLTPGEPVLALADNATITGVGSPGVFTANTHAGGTVMIYFDVGVNATSSPGTIDGNLYLLTNDTNTIISQTGFTDGNTESPNTIVSLNYYLSIPSSVANGTYAVKVDARQPGGSGTPVPSAIISSSIIVISSHTPAQAQLLSPINAACVNANNPQFNWNANVESGYTFTYEFQLSTSSSMTSPVVDTTGSGLSYSSSGLSKTAYYWRVRAIDQYGNPGSWSSIWSVCIDTDTPGNPTPLLTPANGATVSASYNPTYTWTASSGDSSTCANVQYIVETYNNVSLTPPATDNATVGTNSYTRNTLFSGGTYYWRVKAVNCAGTCSAWVGPFSFVVPTINTSYTIQLGTGWNLVSLPLMPSTTDIGTLIPGNVQTLMTNGGGIYYWSYPSGSSAAPRWIWWTPDHGANMWTIEDGKSYWFYVSSPCTFTVTGQPCPGTWIGAPPSMRSYSLYYATSYPDGWNMLGFKSTIAENVSTYLANLTAGGTSVYTNVYRWAGGWVPMAASDNMTPGTGYYIRMTANGTVLPPCQ